MKNLLKKTIVVILTITILLSLCACSGDKREIKSTISNFQHACNELNVEKTLDCIDPSISGPIKIGVGVAGTFTGTDSSAIFGNLTGFFGEHSSTVGIESFKTLKIKVNDIAADESTATVKADIAYKSITGDEETKNITINLKKVSEKWYIIFY